LGRVEWVKDRNNRRRDFSYDINDNLTKEAWGNGIQLQFIYDKVGNLKQSIDGASNTTNIYNYDEIYQLTDATTGNVNFHYDYDVYGDLTKRQERVNSLPTATVEYQYDKNHQLKKLSQSGLGVTAQVMEFGYDRLNQLTNISRITANSDGALVTDYQYNEVGLLKDINNYFVKPTVFNPVTTISNYHYDYDAGNRLTLKSGTDGNSVIDYGKDNQLKSVDNSSRADEAYNFNALGIRNNWSTVTGDSRQVQNDGKFEYRYDDEGNLTRKTELASGNITNYEWDYRNRLSKVSSAGQIVDYQYDAEDRRVGKVINGVTKEKYIYDGQGIALVVDAAGVITEHYLYGAGVDNVLAREANGAVTWSLGDRQGSVVDLVNEQGAILNHFVYDSFGNRTGSTTADFRFGYTGRELDTETGLYYYRARYYDSAVGRFISEDPIGFSAGDTNLHRYVGNNATNYTDPSGNFAFLIGAVATGVELAANAAILFGLGAAAINVTRQNVEILQGSSDGFKLDQFAQSTVTGAAFGLATPFLSAGALTGLGVVGAGFGLLSAKNEYDNERYGTAAFDALTSIPLGFVGKFVSEKLPRMFSQKAFDAEGHITDSLINYGNKANYAKATIEASKKSDTFKDLFRLTQFGEFTNSQALLEKLSKLTSTKIKQDALAGYRNEMKFAAQEAQNGYTVKIGGGKGDVVLMNGKTTRVVQVKTVSAPKQDAFEKSLQGAANQLRGNTNENPSAGDIREIQMYLEKTSGLYTANNSELTSIITRILSSNINRKSSKSYWDSVDRVVIRNANGVFTYNRR
jgi:RHS repeat-associated protein